MRMNTHCPCCAQAPGNAAPTADPISILFVRETLCIARCNDCGTWLANDQGYWEPLLKYESSRPAESLQPDI